MISISRLLIVDDDPVVLRFLSQLVTAHLEQVRVETTDSPLAALDRIKANEYDVVISDVKMPGMNGLDLASHIQTISPCTTIVLISGAPDHSDQIWSCEVFSYITKPIDRNVFLHTVSRAIENSRSQADEQADSMELALYGHCYGD